MQRRLKEAIEKLTSELVMFRDSAQAAAIRSEVTARRSEESAARCRRRLKNDPVSSLEF